jgi:hypothetical protein
MMALYHRLVALYHILVALCHILVALYHILVAVCIGTELRLKRDLPLGLIRILNLTWYRN